MIRNHATAERMVSGLFGLAAIGLVGMIIAYPDQAFRASLNGLTIWWQFVFPALLPFFILSELMLGLGIVHAIGVLLEPAMRVLFRLPGAGGWAVAMGMTVGFPAGAKAAADLRKRGVISRREGNRLLALSHLCSPVFLTSVVAVGFWGHPEFGLPLIVIHFVSALLTGVIVGRIVLPSGGDEEDAAHSRSQHETRRTIRFISAMADAHRRDGRPLGRMLGESVASSFQSLLVIGGFMIVFSVLVKLLGVIGVTGGLQLMLQLFLIPWGMPPQLAEGAVTALFEVHLGAYTLSRSGEASAWAAALLCAMIGWGGLSVHAQVKSLIGGTDLSYRPFLIARILHSVLSVFVAFALWHPLQRLLFSAAPTFQPISSASGNETTAQTVLPDWPQWGGVLELLVLMLLGGVFLSACLRMAALLRRTL